MKKWWACLWTVKAPRSLWWAPLVVVLSSGSLKVDQELCAPLSSENMSLVLLWAWKSTNNRTCALIPFPYSFRRAIIGSTETLESSYSILSSNYVTNQSFIPQLSIIHHMLSTRNRQTVGYTACYQVGYKLSSWFVDSIFANSLN